MSTIRFVEYRDEQATIHHIRHQVFTLEQGVDSALDFDGLDSDALQVLAYHENLPAGTGRMLHDGRIGRIAVLSDHRGTGLGRQIIEAFVDRARQEGFNRVFLGAQVTAVPFYEKLGFSQYGEDYMDAGILHTPMAQDLEE